MARHSHGHRSLAGGWDAERVFGISLLCGIGFTMSLFVANLAFPEQANHLADTKLGILGASVAAGLVGAFAVRHRA